LWGVGKEVFQSLGGGEAFIRSELPRLVIPGIDFIAGMDVNLF
jgi:hypothetical protein